MSKITFCQGDSSVIEVNDATRIRWKRDQQYLTAEGAKIAINASGVYKAVINNVEGIIDSTKSITINVTPTPAAPIVENTAYCIGATTNQLAAIATNNNNLLWYGTAATAGTSTSTASYPTASNAGQTNYYVSQQTIQNACESPRAAITVTVYPKPTKPTVIDINSCIGSSVASLTATASTGNVLKWYGTAANGGTATSTAPTLSNVTTGTFEYYVSQAAINSGCESDRSKITYAVYPVPSAPIIKKDADNFIVSSSATGNIWYKNGVAINDTVQKFKPSTSGNYTVKTNQNGCLSVQSNAYYFLVTDIIHLNDFEFVKLAPNPFRNQLNIDFVIQGNQILNMDVFELSTGKKVTTINGVISGSPIYLGQLSAGTYLIKISTSDNKINQQFKMIKL